LPRVDPANVRVLVTTDDLVVHSTGLHPGSRIFKTLHFPKQINLRRVRSHWIGERLIVMALKAEATRFSATGTERAASVRSHNGRKQDHPS
jgi:hypothetical protein